ncbi:MAG: glycosyltransferase family 39 protein, partial [Polyangiaceae bacterium]
FELNVADLSRRIALHLFGSGEMALVGADNSMPHLNDLGRPELPFVSIALGFKLFGLHEWAGRAPLALWGLCGVIATFGFVSRLVDKRAGVYAAIILTTMPLYFVQARTMLGDIVTMSAFAMSFGGLLVAIFDRDEDGPTSIAARLPWLILGIGGLVAGFYSRGALIGVGIPLASVGLGWGLVWAAGRRSSDSFGAMVGGFAFVGALLAVWVTVAAMMKDDQKNLSVALGAMLHIPSKYPTFDYVVGQLGPALAPWSAFIPFAIGRLFIPPVKTIGFVHQRESFFRATLLVGAAVAFTAHGFIAVRTDLMAFSAPALLAAICAVAIRDFERGAHGSIAVGVGTAVFLGVFHHDFHELPDKAYQAFAVVGATFPESYKEHALLLWTVALIGFAGFAFLTWVEGDSTRRPFDPKNYYDIVVALREAWDGLLALVYFALVAGASLAGLVIWVGVRTHAKWLPTISLQIRDGVLNAWWVTAFVPVAAILGLFFATDVWAWAFGGAKKLSWSSFTRGFEPFEGLFASLRSETEDRSLKLTSVFVLFPFMVLAIPAVVFLALGGASVASTAKAATPHMSPAVAAALALPSGIAVFLGLGLLGDVLRGRRAAGFAFGGAAVGFLLCFSYYPALANQLSPKEVFETYERSHKAG